MEHMLRCNALKCRKEIPDRALVTTCSHIFCTDCANRLGLTGPSGRHEHRNSCPACNSPLNNPDDAVITNLNPSEDYKTSVLSGLSPTVIVECASRALSFWAYQTTQEIVYQEFLGKTLTEKYSNLSVHLDKTINDANTEITNLRGKIQNMNSDQQGLRRKNDELAQAFKEKNRKLLQTQELYDKLKRKAMMGQMQNAAEDAVDSSLHGASIGGTVQGFGDGDLNPGPSFYQEPPSPYGQPHGSESQMQPPRNIYSSQGFNLGHGGQWPPKTVGAQSDVPVTPSTHRQRVGEVPGISLPAIPGLVTGTPRSRAMNTRAPLGDVSNSLRNTAKFPAAGFSSGLKVSHGGNDYSDFRAPSARPQAVQRPAPVASALGRREPGHQPESVIGNIRSGSITGNMHSGFTSR